MSIALSAVLRPILRLRLCLLVGAAACAVAAWELATGALMGGRYRLGWAGAAANLAAGVFLLASLRKSCAAYQLDISPVGQWRLAVYQGQPGGVGPAGQDAVLVRPQAGSTIWPGFLLLLLAADARATTALQVWPAALAPGGFRQLAVALRASAGTEKTGKH